MPPLGPAFPPAWAWIWAWPSTAGAASMASPAMKPASLRILVSPPSCKSTLSRAASESVRGMRLGTAGGLAALGLRGLDARERCTAEPQEQQRRQQRVEQRRADETAEDRHRHRVQNLAARLAGA